MELLQFLAFTAALAFMSATSLFLSDMPLLKNKRKNKAYEKGDLL